MRPFVVLGKVRQESGGGNRACGAAADVLQIGKIGFELLFVFREQRQLPCFVVAFAGGGEQRVHQILVVAHHAAGNVSQRDDARAGERGGINHGFGLEILFYISERVAQHQTPFGIGVQVFNGGAVHGFDHVARFGRAAVGHVFASGDDGYQVNRQLGFGGGDKRANHRRRAAHIVFHLVHAFARFQRDAAAVKS